MIERHDAYEEHGRRHESGCYEALELLRRGPVTREMFERRREDGRLPRLAPAVQMLREMGYVISGFGPYVLDDPNQVIKPVVKVTKAIKDAYYESEHWQYLREMRRGIDNERCVVCMSPDELECHHLRYRLFHEAITDLITVCHSCHERIHANSRIGFPNFVPQDLFSSHVPGVLKS